MKAVNALRKIQPAVADTVDCATFERTVPNTMKYRQIARTTAAAVAMQYINMIKTDSPPHSDPKIGKLVEHAKTLIPKNSVPITSKEINSNNLSRIFFYPRNACRDLQSQARMRS
ncbi:hypothetical protein [Paraburkholderia dipogonis]|uniref:hypothetical protein n=1 Tax=Paraburkholderia dipogonis TaxID=1211383 RepID=UPI0038BCAFC0